MGEIPFPTPQHLLGVRNNICSLPQKMLHLIQRSLGSGDQVSTKSAKLLDKPRDYA